MRFDLFQSRWSERLDVALQSAGCETALSSWLLKVFFFFEKWELWKCRGTEFKVWCLFKLFYKAAFLKCAGNVSAWGFLFYILSKAHTPSSNKMYPQIQRTSLKAVSLNWHRMDCSSKWLNSKQQFKFYQFCSSSFMSLSSYLSPGSRDPLKPFIFGATPQDTGLLGFRSVVLSAHAVGHHHRFGPRISAAAKYTPLPQPTATCLRALWMDREEIRYGGPRVKDV